MSRPGLSFLSILLATFGWSTVSTQALAWSTTTHFGMSVEDQSSTGFDKVAGSAFFLDLGHRVAADLEVGLRTVGQGGKADGREFSRLGAGPFLSYNINNSWKIHASLGVFDETARGEDGAEEYRAKGHSQLLGWGRRFEFGKKVELGYGGFLTRHQGKLTQSSTSPGADAPAAFSGATQGFGHGIAASLKILLD